MRLQSNDATIDFTTIHARYLLFCSKQLKNELIAAEARQLSGGAIDQYGVAFCDSIERVPQSAYIQTGVEILAQGSDFARLVQNIEAKKIIAHDFRIEYMHRTSQKSLGTSEAIIRVANCLEGRPKLCQPAERYVLAELEQRWVFGRLVASRDRSFVAHEAKPFHTSSSLPSQVARGMVNLVAKPGCTLLNPCCGTGSILLEACTMGLHCQGADKNMRMVQMSQGNLAHFGYSCPVQQMDVRRWSAKGDILVADLPYGKNSIATEAELLAILRWGIQACPVGVYATGEDLSMVLLDMGYRQVKMYTVTKYNRFTRYIHHCEQ